MSGFPDVDGLNSLRNRWGFDLIEEIKLAAQLSFEAHRAEVPKRRGHRQKMLAIAKSAEALKAALEQLSDDDKLLLEESLFGNTPRLVPAPWLKPSWLETIPEELCRLRHAANAIQESRGSTQRLPDMRLFVDLAAEAWVKHKGERPSRTYNRRTKEEGGRFTELVSESLRALQYDPPGYVPHSIIREICDSMSMDKKG